jgi:signal transduction histidine kinase/ActR/RegA family two-component response regulator
MSTFSPVLTLRPFDPVAELAAMVVEERQRITRLWAKRLSTELYEVDAPNRELRRPLGELVSELGRLLTDRGEDAVRLWPEILRRHAVVRYEARFGADDLVRELKALHQVLLRVYVRRRGKLEPEVADLLADVIGEATSAAEGAFARVLRTEEVRLRETAVMESLLQHIDVGILLAEEDGRVSYATPPVSRVMGVPARLFVGAAPEALRAILLQLNARHVGGEPFRASDLPFVRALKEKREVHRVGMIIERFSDGREVILEMTALPVQDESGSKLLGAVQTLVDRTETTQKARELTRAYDELRRLQGRLLQRSRAQALGQLASGAAHNLNNFLNVIRLRVTLLRKELKPDHLDALDKTVSNISELVKRLQDFAAQRTLDEEISEVSFPQVVRDALEVVRADLERGVPRIEVHSEVTGSGLVQVDANGLREILVNLVHWARMRMPSGGVIEARAHQEEGWNELSLRDWGPRYEPEDLAHLFDPLKGSTMAPHLSLLLAVARNQVLHWGGELWCENALDGQGAVFRLRLPTAQRAAREEPDTTPEDRAHRPRPRTRRILVVDDEPENARMMAEVLTDEGYEIRIAHSGDDAMRMWREQPFDAALLDALMPDLSGWAIARQIRQLSPNALLAVVTGGDVRGQSRENLALVDAVFRKPVDVDALDEFLARPTLPPEESREVPTLH